MSQLTIAEKVLSIEQETREDSITPFRLADVLNDVNETKANKEDTETGLQKKADKIIVDQIIEDLDLKADNESIVSINENIQQINLDIETKANDNEVVKTLASLSPEITVNDSDAQNVELFFNGDRYVKLNENQSFVNADGDIMFNKNVVATADGNIGIQSIESIASRPRFTQNAPNIITSDTADIVYVQANRSGEVFTINTGLLFENFDLCMSGLAGTSVLLTPATGYYLMILNKDSQENLISAGKNFPTKAGARYKVCSAGTIVTWIMEY